MIARQSPAESLPSHNIMLKFNLYILLSEYRVFLVPTHNYITSWMQ